MIKKIISIKGVGRYKNFNAKDMKINTLFDKLNVIYANNGSGKTTLTAIFKSLQTGNPKVISDRKTIGYNGEQEISILADSRLDFKNNTWNTTLDNLEIFDTFFINENVFSGFEVSLDHKKKLHQFVVGEKGVQLAESIKSTKEEISNEKSEQKDLELKLSNNIREFKVNEFIKIQPDDCIEQKIDSKNKEIEIAKKQKDIERMNKFIRIPTIKLPLDIQEYRAVIDTKIESIDKKYIEKVQSHLHLLEARSVNNAEEWLRDGFFSLSNGDDKCPFCNQYLNNVETLITSYRQFFNEEYKKFKETCSTALEKTQKYNLQIELERTQNILSKNKELFEFWSPLVHTEAAATADTFEVATNINDLYIKVQEELQQKSSNPLNDVKLDNFILLDKELNAFNSFIEEVNTLLEPINNEINALKGSNKNIENLEKELKKLQEERKRFEEPILTYCNEYIVKDDKIKGLNTTNKQMQKQLNDYSTETFQKYGTRINEYLKEFSTHFEIKDIKSSIIGRSKDPSVSYILTLNDAEISFENANGKLQASKALSDGDRSTLALAFFLAKLDIEDNLENKIVIFDDPLSSLDSNRRNKTVNILLEKSQKAKQTFILSHNDSFVFRIYEKSSPKMLTVTYDGKLDDLDQNDMEDLMEHRYFTQIKKIESFCENPNLKESIKELQGSVRIVLEDSIKFRYRKYLKNQYVDGDGNTVGPISNKDGLGKMINILESSDCIFKNERRSVIAELRELNDFSMAPHHGNIESAHREERLTVNELITFLGQTINVIYNKL